MKTHDPRKRIYRQQAERFAQAAKCAFCPATATSIRLPQGDPVCKDHDDGR